MHLWHSIWKVNAGTDLKQFTSWQPVTYLTNNVQHYLQKCILFSLIFYADRSSAMVAQFCFNWLRKRVSKMVVKRGSIKYWVGKKGKKYWKLICVKAKLICGWAFDGWGWDELMRRRIKMAACTVLQDRLNSSKFRTGWKRKAPSDRRGSGSQRLLGYDINAIAM